MGSYLHHGDGEIGAAGELKVRLAGAELGGEDFGVPLAAEEDGPLVEDAQALHSDGGGTAQVSLKGDGVEETHIDGVEAPVEADGLHVHINIEEFGAAALDGQSAVDDVHILELGIEAQVLDAVFVTARIVHFPCMNANCLSDAAEVLHGTGHDFLGHCNTS